MHWRRKWQPTPVFLPGESQGRGARWAVVYGVTQSQTRLKWLSSSSRPGEGFSASLIILVTWFKPCSVLSSLYHLTLLTTVFFLRASQVVLVVKNPPTRRHKRCRFNPWVWKIPQRRKWQPAPVFLPGESHGQRRWVLFKNSLSFSFQNRNAFWFLSSFTETTTS